MFDIIKNWKEWSDFGYQPSHPGTFLLKYNRTEIVDYCQSPNVSLYYLDKEHFYFVKTAAGIDLGDIITFPFHKVAQQDHAIELVKVDQGVMRDYMKGREHDGTNLTLLHTPGTLNHSLFSLYCFTLSNNKLSAYDHSLFSLYCFTLSNNKR